MDLPLLSMAALGKLQGSIYGNGEWPEWAGRDVTLGGDLVRAAALHDRFEPSFHEYYPLG